MKVKNLFTEKKKNVQMNLLNLEQRDWRPNLSTKDKQKAVANCVWMLVVKIEGIERIYYKIVFIRKSNYLFAFQYVWFSTIYNYLHLLCKIDEAGTDFLSTFFTFYLNFRNFKDWITFRSDILDGVNFLLAAWTVQNKSCCNKMN